VNIQSDLEFIKFSLKTQRFNIGSYNGSIHIVDDKISVSGVDLAIKKDSLWRGCSNDDIISLNESSIQVINRPDLKIDNDLIKKICDQNLKKNIIEKVEAPLREYIRQNVKRIHSSTVMENKKALELATFTITEVTPYIESSEISATTRDQLTLIVNNHLKRVKDAVVLYKECSVKILSSIKTYINSNNLNEEQKLVFTSFLDQFRSRLTIGFFINNFDKLEIGSFSEKKALEVLLTPTENGIEQDLLYLFRS